MIHRFLKITDGLYRGSAPTASDVLMLKDKFNIKKIISFDEESGLAIDRACKMLGIKHIMLPIGLENPHSNVLKILKHDLKDLLLSDGPTFIHCQAGKDRTGFITALFKCKYMGVSAEEALEEAKLLGFGIDAPPKMINLFEKLIHLCKPAKSTKSSDIVMNQREYKGDNRDSFLDEANQGSFAPYLSKTRQFPYDPVYNFIYDQSPTRENYQEYKSIKEHEDHDAIPLVGMYDNNAGVRGVGPVESPGGFFFL